jgi:uncharacterized protein (DUF2252 family)
MSKQEHAMPKEKKSNGRVDKDQVQVGDPPGKNAGLPEQPSQREARQAQGRALRPNCPRSSHATAQPEQPQRDPLALIEKSNEGRVASLLPVRFTRMLESPFAFFRGTGIVQASDLAGTPSAGLIVQACGDCHLMNFGAFASPERTLLFDINDFDETAPAPFEWDVKRLAASFVLAARWREFDADDAHAIVEDGIKTYREQMAQYAGMRVLEIWYARITVDDVMRLAGQDIDLRKRVAKAIENAQKRTSEVVFHKLTHEVDGQPRIVDQPPLLYHMDLPDINTKDHVTALFAQYRSTLPEERRVLFDRFQFADAAFKVVGIGSVGTRCFVSLWMADVDDPLFLQLKEARPSVLEGLAGPALKEQNGERVVVGQRLMQSASDIFLGWMTGPTGSNYYVRQLRDQKISADLSTMAPKSLQAYARLCSRALARAHAKSGKAAEISGYLGSKARFDDAITEYAVAYADQVEKDFALFKAACHSGRFPTETAPTEAASALR